MAVIQCTKQEATSKGNRWSFFFYYYDKYGQCKKYHSKKYATKKEAQDQEVIMIHKLNRHELNITDMTFKDLYEEFYEYKSDKVKETTMRTYRERRTVINMLDNVKIKDFDINHYLRWRKMINSRNIAVRTKNGYHKFLKEILNYGTRWHNFNFTAVYNKMEKFTDPNAVAKEMDFYTIEEFKKFISNESDLFFKTAFEVLYFCGLRFGELRGLTWDNIDFDEKTLSVKKNVVNVSGKVLVTSPKSKKSVRTIPITKTLLEDLKLLKLKSMNCYGFNDKYYVFGDVNPLTKDKLRKEKRKLAKASGLKEIRLHDFRHSCASLLINNGASIMIVAKFLGHTKIDETLNTYSHLFKSKMKDIINIMDTLY